MHRQYYHDVIYDKVITDEGNGAEDSAKFNLLDFLDRSVGYLFSIVSNFKMYSFKESDTNSALHLIDNRILTWIWIVKDEHNALFRIHDYA